MAYDAMDNPIGDLIWQTQLHKEDIKLICENQSFWRNILTVWCELNTQLVTTKRQVEEQVIWLNSNIRINKKPSLYVNWYKKGITRIKDIIHADGTFLSTKQIEKKYGFKPLFTELYGLTSVIPTTWKCWLKDTQVGQPLVNWAEMIISSKTIIGWIYKELNENEYLLQDTWNRWQKVSLDCSFDTFKKAVNNIYKITNYTKLRSFQYQLLMKSTVMNIQLE